jgi:membrane peptidoglycan carboxypeptidase
VSKKTGTNEVTRKAAGLGISLDAWAVGLALGLALLVWLGWIKHVAW